MKLLKTLEKALAAKSDKPLQVSPSKFPKISPTKIPKSPSRPQTSKPEEPKNPPTKSPNRATPKSPNSAGKLLYSKIVAKDSKKIPENQTKPPSNLQSFSKIQNSPSRNPEVTAPDESLDLSTSAEEIQTSKNLSKDSKIRQNSPSKLQNTSKIQNSQSGNPELFGESPSDDSAQNFENSSKIQNTKSLDSEVSTEDNTEASSNLNMTSPCKPSKSLPGPIEDFTTQKLILDIQLALGKLLEGCKDEPALVLENLNKVLTPRPSKPSSPRKSGLLYLIND